ncbi:hypothetical protein GSI_11182 [Ganoderma sinense ZZ0214-1]|uniref:endo-1,4-beta-xylanase n=1 Tax=Ganoderma sinense ZZ0214-1 TaxID=1077348 RepID=A0A2G8RZ16_9APHY|nr:hypothetical protein GSI_11182 [Ganoderma sinense ZZ0214-1]
MVEAIDWPTLQEWMQIATSVWIELAGASSVANELQHGHVKLWIWGLVVLFTPVLRVIEHPSPCPPPAAWLAYSGAAPLPSSLPRSGFNAAARSSGKLYFGTATNNYQLNDTAYVAILDDRAMFGQLTPAKAMNWNYTEPERGVFTSGQGDQIVALARQGGKLMRGHDCVWYNGVPAWVANTTWTAPELAEVVQEHCFNIVRRWEGQM